MRHCRFLLLGLVLFPLSSSHWDECQEYAAQWRTLKDAASEAGCMRMRFMENQTIVLSYIWFLPMDLGKCGF